MFLTQRGYNAVAILGVNNFPVETVEQFKDKELEVFFGLDNDTAGEKGTAEIIRLFRKESYPDDKINTVEFPQGIKDFSELFLRKEKIKNVN